MQNGADRDGAQRRAGRQHQCWRGAYSGSGSIAAPGLAPQASSSALQVNLDTAHRGAVFTGSANLALASHDADLADLALRHQPAGAERAGQFALPLSLF